MRSLQFASKTFSRDLAAFCESAVVPREIVDSVSSILADVRQRGDEAVGYYAAKFDGAKLRAREFRVKPTELEAAAKRLPEAENRALVAARESSVACPRLGCPRTRKEPWSERSSIQSDVSGFTYREDKFRSYPRC